MDSVAPTPPEPAPIVDASLHARAEALHAQLAVCYTPDPDIVGNMRRDPGESRAAFRARVARAEASTEPGS